jgi:hypothetical protein
MRFTCVLPVIAACAAQGRDPGASIDGTPVASFEASGCSTESVIALSRQIADEIDCMMPGQFVRFEPGPVIELSGGGILPYLGADARDDLYLAAAEGNAVMRVTSAFRTVVQQYLLRTWFEHGRCGIAAASEPGESNHETGRALDIGNEEAWIAIMAAHGWDHPLPDDPVHFEHPASPDVRGADVHAFQRLWNRNAPDDAIDESGSYDAATAARVKRAPAEGFGLGAICTPVAGRQRTGRRTIPRA